MDFFKNFEKIDFMKNFEGFNMDQFSNVGKDAMDSIMRINETASSRIEQLFRLSSEIASETFENNMSMLKSLGEIKKPEDLVSSNMNYLSDISKKAIENTQKYVDFCVDCQSEMTSLLQDTVAAKATTKGAGRKAA